MHAATAVPQRGNVRGGERAEGEAGVFPWAAGDGREGGGALLEGAGRRRDRSRPERDRARGASSDGGRVTPNAVVPRGASLIITRSRSRPRPTWNGSARRGPHRVEKSLTFLGILRRS